MLLSDPDHEAASQYGVWQEKKLYGRTYFGIVRSHFVLNEAGRIVDAQIGVSPSESVAKAVASVMS